MENEIGKLKNESAVIDSRILGMRGKSTLILITEKLMYENYLNREKKKQKNKLCINFRAMKI